MRGMSATEVIAGRHPESKLYKDYLFQRDIKFELLWSTVQKSIAGGTNSPCRQTRKWTGSDEDCNLYHKFFPAAELLDMVSSPIHHPELYLDALNKHVLKEDAQIWIPAFASPRTYDMARWVKPKSIITATDLCVSPPLALGNIYRGDLDSGLLIPGQLNILDAKFENKFDAILTDAFITRFTGEDKKRVLRILYKALKPGGVLLTTVRIPGGENASREAQLLERLDAESQNYPRKVRKAYESFLTSHQIPKDTILPYTPDGIETDAGLYQLSMRSSHKEEPDEHLGGALLPKLEEMRGTAGYMLLLGSPPEKGGIGFIQTHINKSQQVYDITTRQYLQIAAIK